MPDGRDDFDVRHVASLARLLLTPDEERLYARQIGELLAYAEELIHIDAPIPPHAPETSGEAPPEALRDDRVRPPLAADVVLGGAPDRTSGGGLFRVPRVIG